MPETPEIPEELPPAEVEEATPSLPEGDESASAETPPSSLAAEAPETAKENDPMLDVHMPQATHTWKDFFIRLGTITAGLLIPISLEQSVEKIHHLHQRNELEASLRAEGEVNKQRVEVGLADYDDQMTWLLGLHQDIGRMMATGGKANLPYRTRQDRLESKWTPVS